MTAHPLDAMYAPLPARILGVLARARQPVTLTDLATATGRQPPKVWEAVEALRAAGIVEVATSPPDGPGRPGKIVALDARAAGRLADDLRAMRREAGGLEAALRRRARPPNP